MASRGRNQRCECGSGRKTKTCCGVRRGPGETALATAFLATVVTPATIRGLLRRSREEFDELHAEMTGLPEVDSALQVPLPRLVTPALDAMLTAIEHDDLDTLEASIPAVLAQVDTPVERARLARAVITRRDAGQVSGLVADVALVELATPTLNAFVTSALLRGAAVAAGAARTPTGLLLAG